MSQVREYVGCKSIEAVNYDGKGNDLCNMWVTDEEIVRCRDCQKKIGCPLYLAQGQDPNGFCKWGKRHD